MMQHSLGLWRPRRVKLRDYTERSFSANQIKTHRSPYAPFTNGEAGLSLAGRGQQVVITFGAALFRRPWNYSAFCHASRVRPESRNMQIAFTSIAI